LTDDASYVSTSSSAETVWLVGFFHAPKTATYTFTLNTNGDAALFLSTNDDPANKALVASSVSNQSTSISLTNQNK